MAMCSFPRSSVGMPSGRSSGPRADSTLERRHVLPRWSVGARLCKRGVSNHAQSLKRYAKAIRAESQETQVNSTLIQLMAAEQVGDYRLCLSFSDP